MRRNFNLCALVLSLGLAAGCDQGAAEASQGRPAPSADQNEANENRPVRAVRGQGGDRYCLVAREGVLEKAPVVIASDDGRQAVIAQGLDPEDSVMVAGSPLARAGVPIEAVEEESK